MAGKKKPVSKPKTPKVATKPEGKKNPRPTAAPSAGGSPKQTVGGATGVGCEGEQRPNPTSASAASPTPSQASASASGAAPAGSTQGTLFPGSSATSTSGSFMSKIAAHKTEVAGVDRSPHLVVVARAGTGKTTTIVEGMKHWKGLDTRITPSEQQRKVWDEIAKSPAGSSCVFVAFNRSIAQELKDRVPPGVEAMTMHSLGMRAVNRAFPRLKVNEYRVQDLISLELGRDVRELRREEPVLLKATQELVGLCKMNLAWCPYQPGNDSVAQAAKDQVAEELDILVDRHGVELENRRAKVFELVPKILERCKDPRADGSMDFDDMVWLPVVLQLPVQKFDVLFGDEVQDWNRCQQALAKMAGRRLILVGDDRQAIYGFAGADSDSIPRMRKELEGSDRGCVVVPLTVTRRCGKAIVAEARRYVPDFTAHESNPEGKVSYARYEEKVQ